MCGINGIIDFKNRDNSVDIKKMNKAIDYRGPDNNNYWKNNFCTLGHLRLSIIDLQERSNQPFIKDNFVIIFNGEIYNFKELKNNLNNVQFITNSDTEVILELWKKYGIKSLNMLRGMFAFAILDIKSQEIYLVRDQFGIKPLFFKNDGDKVIFSSEIKAINKIYNKNKINKDALVASAMYVYIPEDFCIFKNINKLKPGSLLKISKSGNIELQEYWKSSSLIKSKTKLSKNKAINKLNNILLDSVQKHLIADVPISTFLSGGLDSSLITAMACSMRDKIDCYCIAFQTKDQSYENMASDYFYAKKCAKFLGVKINKVEAKPDLIELLKKTTYCLDEPIGDSSAISTYIICEMAKKAGVKVLLSGMGADEIFGGYRKHLANIYANYYKYIPLSLQKLSSKIIHKVPVSSEKKGFTFLRWLKRFINFAGLEEKDCFLKSYTYFSEKELNKLFNFNITNEYNLVKENHHKFFNFARKKRDLVDSMCYTDLNNFMTSLNLTYSDRASMLASTEIRVPFIDMEVIKFAFSLDSKYKIRRFQQKYILKKVAENWLPKDIIYRNKSSFTLPLRSWIKNDFKNIVYEYLLSKDGLSGRNIFKPNFLETLINDELQNREDNAQKIWYLLVLEQWFKNQGEF